MPLKPILLTLAALNLLAQTTAPPKPMAEGVDPSFEVATIKPTANPGRQGSNITVTPAGQFATGNTSLKDILISAYGVHPSQFQGLPSWAEDDKYDISAKPDQEGLGNETQIRTMLQKLIATRFALKVHREKKDVSAYTLNICRTGQPKRPPNTSGVNLPGFRIGAPGTLGARNATMEQFGGFLQARVVDRPVIDRTGLSGRFDFTLTWRTDDLGPTPTADLEARPDIFGAMQEQLGLRFQAEHTSIDVLVIDAVSKPSEN